MGLSEACSWAEVPGMPTALRETFTGLASSTPNFLVRKSTSIQVMILVSEAISLVVSPFSWKSKLLPWIMVMHWERRFLSSPARSPYL